MPLKGRIDKYLTNAMAGVSDNMRKNTYYHGTSSDDKGQSIMKNGINPGNLKLHARGKLTPVVGRTYLTTDLHYATIYCIGGDFTGGSVPDAWLEKEHTRYGWLFCINGSTLANDVQPDEDSVGKAVMLSHGILNKSNDLHYYTGDPLYEGLLITSHDRLSHFLDLAKHTMTAKQFRCSLHGLIDAQASGGKRMLKAMGDWMKLWLISCGAHVAYKGPLVPDRAWRFDKLDCDDLTKNCSNFFDLAKQIK